MERYDPSVRELTDGYRRPSIHPARHQSDVDDDEDLRCGFFGCTPGWMQWFHTSRWLLAVLSFCTFVQSFVVNSIFPVGLSTLERRYHMNSSQTGIISSWYDLANLIAVFPVCHWGARGHKGRWIAAGCILMGLGSLVCALPQFTVAPYQVGTNAANKSDFGQCTHRGEQDQRCKKEAQSSDLSHYFYVFLLGQTLHGLGSTPLFSIGTTYIDENVSQKASPVYLALNAVVASIGPAVGLIVGGFLLNIYTDFNRADWRTTGLEGPGDPRWIGAWWLGFLGSGVMALIATLPMCGFARELPEAKKHRLKDVDQVHAVSYVEEDDEILSGHLKHLPKAVWNILRNPTFDACMVVSIFESIVINGFAAFMPKILETILSTTPTIASYLSSMVIFAAALGVIVGGIAIRKMKLQVGGMLKLMVVCHLIALFTLATFLLQCPPRTFVGINIDYSNEKLIEADAPSSLDATCNRGCDCTNEWNPVCHIETGASFYSACHAGCTVQISLNDSEGTLQEKEWLGCTCLKNFLHNQTISKNEQKLSAGYCKGTCSVMWIFLALVFISVVASFASGIPTQQIILRVVPFKHRTLGIGVNWTIVRLFGFIPGGVLFGLMIDTTCIKWQRTCKGRGSCLVYDPGLLSWTLFGLAVVCKIGSIAASIVGYLWYRPNDQDNELSVQTADSRGPLQLTVNDDRRVPIVNKIPVKQ